MAAKPRAVVVVAALAVAIAAVASIALYRYLQGQEARTKAAYEMAVATEKVVVAGDKEMPIGVTLDATKVRTMDWPKASLPQGYFSSPEQVAGRVPLQTIVPGDIITEAKLVPATGPPSVMIYKIPEGHRAMTVGVDQVSGVAGFITPGSMVDVVLTTTPPGYEEPISKIVFQDVPVLATGQIIEQKEGNPVLVPTVTLDVVPADAEKLASAGSRGTIQLILRRSGDTDILNTPGATVTRVMTGAPGKVPAIVTAKKAAPMKGMVAKRAEKSEEKVEVVKAERAMGGEGLYAVEVWRNGNKTTEKVPAK